MVMVLVYGVRDYMVIIMLCLIRMISSSMTFFFCTAVLIVAVKPLFPQLKSTVSEILYYY